MKIKKFCSFMTAITLLFVSSGNKSIEAADFNTLEKSKLATALTADAPKLLTEEEIPDAIDYSEALKKGHCERVLEDEENLNSLVFKNNDGTQSCYLFNYPVKYVDNSGKIKDKSMDIKKDSKSDDFTSASSDIKTTFNKELSDGVELTYEDINIQMIPNFITKNTTSADLSDDQQSVSYDCNSNVSLEYSLTYQGFKEDIILDKYTGVTEFSFTLLTNGLKLSKDDAGNFNLYNKSNTPVANIGEIIIFDSNNNNSIGTLSYTAIKENQEYTLTITVDENYLTSPNTVYPVYIDPTIEIDYEHYGPNLYGNHDEQAITYATYDSNNKLTFNGSMTIGKYGSKITRVLMRFPVLFSHFPKNVSASSRGFECMNENLIKSAKVYLRDVGYQSDLNAMNISCYRFQTHWSENTTLDWNDNSSKYNPKVLTTHNICHSNGLEQEPLHTYAFDITSAVKNWGSSSMNTNYWKFGIMFKADDSIENGNTSKYCSFGSYNSVYYAPYLVIDYEAPYAYEAVEDAPISYTYRRNCNLEAGKTYIFQTEKATNYDNSNTELYLFKSTMTPQDYTWFNDNSSGQYSRIEATIQESGSYTLMAKCHDEIIQSGECTKGYCNIYQVDPETQEKTLLQENAQLGGYMLKINNSINSYDTYNSFTVNKNYFDTIMYILSQNSVSGDRKVIGYNDDYRGDGDFYWRLASRVKQRYSTNNTPNYIFVSSFNPTASDTVDIYGMCKGTYSNTNMFPNLKDDDVIVSAPPSDAYNCIAYSGGITHEWINPDLTFHGGTLSPWYNENNEIALDNYYGNTPPRYVGAMSYTVTDNEDEAVINVYKKGNEWTHASVRKPANNRMHGYDWESKLGHQEQIFHPRNSLDNENYVNAYGHIEKMYKIANTNSTSSTSTYNLRATPNEDISFEESVEAGLTEVQSIDITESEKEFLENKINEIDKNTINEFMCLYNDWINGISNNEKLSISSNSCYFTQTPEYKKLSAFINANDSLECLILKMYMEDSNVFNTTLFNIKIVGKNTKTLELANDIREKNNKISTDSLNSSTYIAPTYNTNALCFIKEILNDESYSILK